MFCSLQIPVVKRVSALGAEFRRIRGISRLPATFVTFVLRDAGRFRVAALGAHLHDLALVDDNHALTVSHRNDRPIGDDVLRSLVVAAAAGDSLLTLDGHDVFGHRLAIEIFFPLVGHHAASCAQCCSN